MPQNAAFHQGPHCLLWWINSMGESSKFHKSWTLENQNLKFALCLQNIKNSKLNGQIHVPLDKLKQYQKSYYNLQNSAIEFRNNPENFHPWNSSGTELHHYFKVSTCDPLKYIIYIPILIVCIFVCLIWFFMPQPTIFQLCRDESFWLEPVLS